MASSFGDGRGQGWVLGRRRGADYDGGRHREVGTLCREGLLVPLLGQEHLEGILSEDGRCGRGGRLPQDYLLWAGCQAWAGLRRGGLRLGGRLRGRGLWWLLCLWLLEAHGQWCGDGGGHLGGGLNRQDGCGLPSSGSWGGGLYQSIRGVEHGHSAGRQSDALEDGGGRGAGGGRLALSGQAASGQRHGHLEEGRLANLNGSCGEDVSGTVWPRVGCQHRAQAQRACQVLVGEDRVGDELSARMWCRGCEDLAAHVGRQGRQRLGELHSRGARQQELVLARQHVLSRDHNAAALIEKVDAHGFAEGSGGLLRGRACGGDGRLLEYICL